MAALPGRRGTLRNQRRIAAVAVQFVPGVREIAFDSARRERVSVDEPLASSSFTQLQTPRLCPMPSVICPTALCPMPYALCQVNINQ
eukprot:605745-Rhodomonas_salina.1